MDTPAFSSLLLRELALALDEYAVGTPLDGARLQAATHRICTEAHDRKMAPERMVISLKGFYEGLPPMSPREEQRRRTGFDHVLSGCIRAYFAAEKKPAS